MKRISCKEEVCIGCHLCEIACVTEHSRSKDVVKAYKEESPRPTPRNLVEEEGALSFSVACRHCDEPSCVEACIAGAMVKDYETGVVTHHPEKCVGCWSCVMSCSRGAVKIDPTKTKVIKCDLCPDREVPACVAACPNRALICEEK